jgi:hypothetical protein
MNTSSKEEAAPTAARSIPNAARAQPRLWVTRFLALRAGSSWLIRSRSSSLPPPGRFSLRAAAAPNTRAKNKATEHVDDGQNEQRHYGQTQSTLLNKGCPASSRQALVLETQRLLPELC